MKLWQLILLIFLTTPVSAFFIMPQGSEGGVTPVEKTVRIEISESIAHIEISTEFHNPGSSEIVFQEIEPLLEGTSVEGFFIDMEGKAYSLVSGSERLEALFNYAQQVQDSQLLKLGSAKYPKLFRSENITLGAEKKLRTKKVFNVPVSTRDDFSFLTLLFDEQEFTLPVEISVTIHQPIKQFLHSLGSEALVDQGPEQTVLFWKGTSVEEISFFWSSSAEATMKVPYLGMNYTALFVAPQPRQIEEVTILLDRSGSLLGTPWQRAKDWTEFLLETLGEEVRVRVGFFSDDIEWHNKEFQQNTFDFKKDFFGFLSGISPVGKTDINAIFDFQFPISIASEGKENELIVVITDQEDLNKDIFEKDIKNSYIVLQFSEDLENDLALFAKLSGGFSMKLFRTSPNLVEKDEFLNKFSRLNTNIVQREKWDIPEILPKMFLPQMRLAPFFFVGRDILPSLDKNVSEVTFVPRGWGAFKIAEILQSFLPSPLGRGIEGEGILKNPPSQSFSQEETEGKIDALLAIGRTFGIPTKFFNDTTTRGELEKNLKSASKIELMKEILKLNSSNSNPHPSPLLFEPEPQSRWPEGEGKGEIRFLNGIPMYKMTTGEGAGEVGWQQFNFLDLVRSETLIEIAPFSEAQRQLFVQFPEFVAEGFGLGEAVNFCTEFRCISVRDGARAEPKVSDRAFFKEYDSNHWAHSYIVRAVNEGLLEPESNGKLHPDRPVDRAEFAVMVVKAFGLNSGYEDTYPKFEDVHDPVYFDAVNVLAQKGVVKGYEDGTFRPLQSLTRAEGVKMLLAVRGWSPHPNPLPEGEGNIFLDVTGWEKPWVTEAVKRGMVRGYDDGTFRPHNKLTRAEALKLLYELLK